jgi:hypothetical protein
MKTEWYCDLHGVGKMGEHDFAKCAVEGKIDDIYNKIGETHPLYEKVKRTENIINKHITDSMKLAADLNAIGDKMSTKDFAMKYKEHKMFQIAMVARNKGYEKAEARFRKRLYHSIKKSTWGLLKQQICGHNR